MSRKVFPKAFLIGADNQSEWMIEWFLRNYFKHKNETKLVFADFGLSERMKKLVNNHPHILGVMEMENKQDKSWFMKPETMWFAPIEKCIWLDIDIEIKDNIDDLFDYLVPNKLCMVEDKPWTKRRGSTWYNSGVVGFIHKPQILKEWALKTANKNHNQPGDQEVLHSMLNPIMQLTHIHSLPNEYNVLRLQVENDNYKGPIKMLHWTGPKGKEKIREMINA